MIAIDKTDELYKYLNDLGVRDIDETYMMLAKLGRYKRKDVLSFFRSGFEPSLTNDFEEKDLEEIVDYYADLKQTIKLNSNQIKQLIKEYSSSKDKRIKDLIISYYLKDILMLCLNYKSLHKDINLQDLVQIANIGLMEALDNFDDTKKIKFDDYVIYYVYKNVTDEYKEKE